MTLNRNWPLFVKALRQTLVEHAPAKSERDRQQNPDRVEERRALIKANLKRQSGVRFNINMSDKAFWKIAAFKPFYAGKVAWTVDKRVDYMWSTYLHDREALSDPRWNEGGELYNKFLNDEDCFRNSPSLEKTLKAARRINEWKKVRKCSMIEFYTYGIDDVDDPVSLMRIYNKLKSDFIFGPVAVYHLMMELGFSFVKPDRVLNLITARLGLVTSYQQRNVTYVVPNSINTTQANSLAGKTGFVENVQNIYREIANVSGVSMRSLDYMIAKLGQNADLESGFARPICAPKNPQCHICKLKPFCSYGSQQR
jgi:hypothetical protein